MKRILLAVAILVLAGAVYAQQSDAEPLPNSSQTKQNAQQFSSQAKSNASQFATGLADLTARNTSNKDLENFNRLKSEIDQLETKINTEQGRVKANLDKGQVITPASLNRIDSLIKQHQEKIAELDAFISGS